MLCAFYCLPSAVGEPPLVTKVMPKGDYVCSNEATMIMCHYDRPADAVNVVWNIPGQSGIDLSAYVGHVMNYSSMSEGSVFVIVEDFRNLLGFYGCSVLYRKPRVLFETSSNSFVPSPVQESGNINITDVSVSNTGLFERTITWNTSFNKSDCVEMIVVFGDNEHATSRYSYTLSNLPPVTSSTHGRVQAVVNGDLKSEVMFVIDMSSEVGMICGMILILVILVVLVISVCVIICCCIHKCKRKRNGEADGSEEARITKKNEVQEETKDNVKIRVLETGVYEEERRAYEAEKGTRVFEEDKFSDGSLTSRDGLLGPVAT